jgi:hypothetical protein
MTDYYDRDGQPMPDDWYDRKKHGDKAVKWGTDRRVARTVVGDITVSTTTIGTICAALPTRRRMAPSCSVSATTTAATNREPVDYQSERKKHGVHR